MQKIIMMLFMVVIMIATSARAGGTTCVDRRPLKGLRKFRSDAVDAAVENIAEKIKDKEIACLFRNTLPNTLDTTVEYFSESGPDTFIITGDIAAMWLRDSTNQVLPYMRFAALDKKLASMIKGLVKRQTRQILTDVYANAHNFDSTTGNTPHQADATTKPTIMNTSVSAMQPLVFERKYELDSLAAFLKLGNEYHYALPKDLSPFDETWVSAVSAVIKAMRGMQTSTANDPGIYRFQRDTTAPTDTLWQGTGFPGAKTGMVRSGKFLILNSINKRAMIMLICNNLFQAFDLRTTHALIPSTFQRMPWQLSSSVVQLGF